MNALAVAQALNALLQIAADAGVNYRRLMLTYERARQEGREPTEEELLESARARDEAIDQI